jgi:signal recognition particle subunit SRP54
MPGMGGGGKKAKQQAKKSKGKRGSGNPAKRAGGGGQPAQPQPGQLPAAFGGGAAGGDFELPDALKNMLDGKDGE